MVDKSSEWNDAKEETCNDPNFLLSMMLASVTRISVSTNDFKCMILK